MAEKRRRINNTQILMQVARKEGKDFKEWLTQETLVKSTRQIVNERNLGSSGMITIQKLKRRYQVSTPMIIDSEKSEESKDRSGSSRRGKTQTGRTYTNQELRDAYREGATQGLSMTEVAKNLGFTQHGSIVNRLGIVYPEEVTQQIQIRKTENARIARKVKVIEEKKDFIQEKVTPDIFARLDDLQKAIVMRYFEEDSAKAKTNAEIAQEHGIPESKVQYTTKRLFESLSGEDK
jgi:hypothetical protein